MYLSWHPSAYVPGVSRWTRFCSTVTQHWPSVDPLFCNNTFLKLLLPSWLLAGIQQPICYVIRVTHSPKSFYNSKMGLFLLHVFYLSFVLANSLAEVIVENPQCWFYKDRFIMTKHNITPCFCTLYWTQYLGHVYIKLPEACALS